jgi:hypothetical protein
LRYQRLKIVEKNQKPKDASSYTFFKSTPTPLPAFGPTASSNRSGPPPAPPKPQAIKWLGRGQQRQLSAFFGGTSIRSLCFVCVDSVFALVLVVDLGLDVALVLPGNVLSLWTSVSFSLSFCLEMLTNPEAVLNSHFFPYSWSKKKSEELQAQH